MLYPSLVLASVAYLWWGFRFEIRSLLKVAIAAQILGDLIFSPILQELPVFRFVKSLTSDDKLMPLILLMGCVLAMDLGAFLVGPKTKGRLPLPPLTFDPKQSRAIGWTLVSFALVAKLMALYASGITTFSGILTWQPEDLVGLSFLDTGASLAFPLGCALVALAPKKSAHIQAILAILAFSVFSPWKGSAATMLLLYGLTVSHFGAKELKAILWSRWTAAILAIVALMLSIKAQYRYTGEASTDSSSLVAGFIGGTAVRFMGGNFQTYAYAYNSVEQGAPLMDGDYNAQALFMWIPRQLWQDKPRFAGEKIYEYLDLTTFDEPEGQSSFSLSVFGTFFIDFGKWLALFCSLALGILLGLGDRLILRFRKQGIKYVALSALWLNGALALSEAGLPALIPMLLCGVAILYGAEMAATLFVLLMPKPLPLSKSQIT